MLSLSRSSRPFGMVRCAASPTVCVYCMCLQFYLLLFLLLNVANELLLTIVFSAFARCKSVHFILVQLLPLSLPLCLSLFLALFRSRVESVRAFAINSSAIWLQHEQHKSCNECFMIGHFFGIGL